MVRNNFQNFHALIGLLAASLAIHAGCSGSFEGCKASRTCPPKGGESGTGNGGESGDANTGGASGKNTGGSGSGRGGTVGTGNPGGETGEGGTAGAGEDTERPTIVSFAPADGDVDIERDSAITATFSEPIDERTVTTTSFALTGPGGEVPGTLAVDGNVVAFTPSRKLWLLGDYVLTVSGTVADLAGNRLDESVSVGFRIRDGRWSEPTFPFGPVASGAGPFQRNSVGDIVVGTMQSGALELGVYHAANDQWSTAGEIASGESYAEFAPFFGVAIDPAGRAVAAWTDYTQHGGWWRTTDGERWIDAGALGDFASVTVTSTGFATAARWSATSSGIETRTMDLRNGSLEPPANVDLNFPGIGPYPVASLDRTAILARTSPSTGDEVLWISWKDGSTWTQPEPIASAPRIFNFTFDSDEHGNIIVVWTENDRIWSRTYDRSVDSWTGEEFVATTSSNASVGNVDMTNGNAILSFSSDDPTRSRWVAVYEAGNGWVESWQALLDDQQGSAAGIALDDAGNGIAICVPVGLGTQVRRFVAGIGWQPPSAPPVGFHPNLIYAATAFDRSVSFATATVGTLAPRAIRFE